MISRITIVVLLSVKVFISGNVIGKTRQSPTIGLEKDNLSDMVLNKAGLNPLDSSPLYRGFKVDNVHSNAEHQNFFPRDSNFRNLSVIQKMAIISSKNSTNPLLDILVSDSRQTKSNGASKRSEPKTFHTLKESLDKPQEDMKNTLSMQNINQNPRRLLILTNPSFGLSSRRRLRVSDSFLLGPKERNTLNDTVVDIPTPPIPAMRYGLPIKSHKLLKRLHYKDMIKGNVPYRQLNISKDILAALSLSPKVFFHQKRKANTIMMKKENLKQQPFPNFFVKRSKNLPIYEAKTGLRKRRRFDIPQIECPPTADGTDRFSCPSPDHMGRYKCIINHLMCDGFIDCPNAEDEDRMACMFYQTTKAHLDVLTDALLKWAGGHY